MDNRIVHVELSSPDHSSLRDFYAGVFDWELKSQEGQPYDLVDDGSRPTIGLGAPPEGYPGHVTFYVMVDDPAKKLEEIESKGGKTVQPVMEVPNGPTIALFADPSGNTIGLIKS